MNKLLLIASPLICVCAAAETVPQLHLLHLDYVSPGVYSVNHTLTLKLAALTDKKLHERCMQDIQNPPETLEERPDRYEEEKIWALEEGGYNLVGRSCVSEVKAQLKVTDNNGVEFIPSETEIKEDNGVLLITLTFDLSEAPTLPEISAMSVCGSVEYNAHYNFESELTEPVAYTVPSTINIDGFTLDISNEEDYEEEEDDDEEVAEETEDSEEEETAEEEEELEEDEESDTPSGCITIEPIDGNEERYNLITNIIIYQDFDGEYVQVATFGNGDITECARMYICNEGALPPQGKISLRLRKKSHHRHYQFNQQLRIQQTK